MSVLLRLIDDKTNQAVGTKFNICNHFEAHEFILSCAKFRCQDNSSLFHQMDLFFDHDRLGAPVM